MMEKRGIIEQGRTPPEDATPSNVKEAKEKTPRELEQHLTTRLADRAAKPEKAS